MFEKLKEYGLYIVLGLIALGALAYAYVQTSNSQKGADIESANLDAMVTAMSKSDKLKKSSTVADDLLAANGGRSIGKYTIDSSKVSYVIGETYDEIFDNKQMLDISADVADVDDGQLRTILIAKPAAQVNGNDINTVQLNSDKSLTIGNNTISREDLNDVADELKGYNIGAIGYTTFDTEQEAKDFRDTYFSSYEVYQIGTTGKYAILKEYNQGGESTSIDGKIDTQTREDLLALNNGTGNNQQNNEPQQTEEEILAAQVATIKSNLFDEVTDLQTYLTSQGLNSTNNTTVDNMINQVIAKINGINGTNKDEKNTEIQNDIATIQALIDSLKAEEVAAASIPTCEGYQELVGGVCQTAIYLDSNGITMKATNYAIAGHEYTLSGVTYYVATNETGELPGGHDSLSVNSYSRGIKGCIDARRKIANGTYQANRIITTKCTSMNALFSSTDDFNEDISNWDTSNVTNMSQMFHYSGFNQDIGHWDTGNVTNTRRMFYGNHNFNQNIGNWNVGSLTNMSEMFAHAINFNNGGSNSINNWNVSNVTNMSQAFLMSHFNQPIGNWNVSNVTNMRNMLWGNGDYTYDLSGWNVSNVTDVSANTEFCGTTVVGQIRITPESYIPHFNF